MTDLLKKLDEMTRYDVEVLPNGAKLITQYRPGLSVNTSIKFKYGMAFDEKPQTSHFAEHMIFKKGSKEEYRKNYERLEKLSASGVNATTHAEAITLGNHGIFVSLPHKSADLIRTIGDMLTDERMESASFESEREVLITEMTPVATSECNKFARKAWSLFWGESHPYSQYTNPGIESLRTLSLNDINNVFGYLNGPNAVIAIVGDFNQDVLDAARTHFGWRILEKAAKLIPQPSERGSHVLQENPRDLTEPYVRVNFRIPGETHRDIISLRFLRGYFNQFPILQRSLRDENSLCYGAYATVDENSMGSAFSIVASRLVEENVPKILDKINQEVEKLKQGDINAGLVQRMTEETEKSVLTYESSDQSANAFASIELFNLFKPVDYVQTQTNMKPQDLQRLAQTYFTDPVIAIGLKS